MVLGKHWIIIEQHPRMRRLTREVLFNSEYLSQDLAQKSVRGGMTTMSAQVIKFVLSTASTVVLARILTPEDYGLIAMVTVVVGFAAMFKDAGLSMATVQKDRISHEQISTLFWINIIISAFLGVCVLVASPLVAKFYGRPELAAVTAVLSVSFIISGLMIQHQALLIRHMKFGTLAIIQIASQIITLVVTIGLALLGWRYWALVGGTISTALAGTILTLFLCPWVPGRMKKGTGVRDMLKFGGHLTGFSFVNYFARNLDNVLIGKYWGSQSLGQYSKAYNLLLLPISQITAPISAVAVPALSRLQNDPERFRNYYLKAIKLIAYITMPLVAAMCVLSTEIVELILGKQWFEAGSIFRILAVAAFIQPIGSTVGWIYVSLGQTRRMLAWACIAVPLTVLSFIVGLRWGALGVASGYAIYNVLLFYPSFLFALKHSPISVGEVFLCIRLPIALSVILAFAMSIARAYLAELGLIWIIVFTLVVGGIVFLSLVRLLNPFWTDIKAILATTKLVFGKR